MSNGSVPQNAQPALDHRSTARVSTTSPASYGHRLVGHMAHKVQAEWDEAASTGRVTFNREGPVAGVAELACEEDALVLALSATVDELGRLEEVIGSHLARFGYREGLTVSWEREGGAPGTTQGPLTEEDLERVRRDYEGALGTPATPGDAGCRAPGAVS